MTPEEEAKVAAVRVLVAASNAPQRARLDVGVELYKYLWKAGRITLDEISFASGLPVRIPTLDGRIIVAAPELGDLEYQIDA